MPVEDRERFAEQLDIVKQAVLDGRTQGVAVVMVLDGEVQSMFAAPGVSGLAGTLLGLQSVSQQILLLSLQ